jgi:hypothetical protein
MTPQMIVVSTENFDTKITTTGTILYQIILHEAIGHLRNMFKKKL